MQALYITASNQLKLMSEFDLPSFKSELASKIRSLDGEEERKYEEKDSQERPSPRVADDSAHRAFPFDMSTYMIRKAKARAGSFNEIGDQGTKHLGDGVFVILRPRHDMAPALYDQVVEWLKARYFCRKLDKRCVTFAALLLPRY